jgi:hypothetical protein
LHERPVDKHAAKLLKSAATGEGGAPVPAEVNEPPFDRAFVVRDSHHRHPLANFCAAEASRARLRLPQFS